MRRKNLWRVLGALTAALFVQGCDKKDEEVKDPELVALCQASVRAETCFGDLPEGYDIQGKVDDCVDTRQPDAEARSAACGEAHRGLMACLEGKDCHDDLSPWFDERLVDGDYACNAETASFRDACPGLWFAPK
jgi:hypothetical protein